MVPALERHEAGARNPRGDQSAFLERRALVLATVEHERRRAHVLRQLGDVDAARHVEDPLGRFRRRRQALHLVERGDLLGRSVRQELGGEELPECGVVPAPTETDEPALDLRFLDLRPRTPLQASANEPAIEDEVADALRMPGRVGDRERRALRRTEQGEAREAGSCDDRLEIGEPRRERDIGDVPVGKTAAALVVSHECVVSREFGQPRAPDRAFPVALEVGHPVGRAHERRAFADGRIGEAHAVRSGAEPDLLARRVHRRHSRNARLSSFPFALRGSGSDRKTKKSGTL